MQPLFTMRHARIVCMQMLCKRYSWLNNARSTQIQKYKRYGWQAANIYNMLIYIINEQEGMLSWLRKTIFLKWKC